MNEIITPKARRYILKQLIFYQHYTDNSTCNCIKPQKYLFDSSSPSYVLPYKERISLYIVTAIGGRVHFGNRYLGKETVANYLGRFEGQPGGSGTPIRNKF